MIRIIDSTPKPISQKTKPMHDMQPLEVCVVVDSFRYTNNVVMRTADIDHFEVMDLTLSRPDTCWVGKPSLKVRELYPGEAYTLELS